MRQWFPYRFYLASAGLTVLFLLNCFWGEIVWLVFPCLFLLVIFDDLPNGLSYLLLAMPFCCLRIFTSIILYAICILTYIGKYYFWQYVIKKQKSQHWLLISVALFFIYCLLPLGPYNLRLFLKLIGFLIIFVLLGIFFGNQAILRLRFNLRVLGVAILIAGVYGLLYHVSPYLQSQFAEYHLGGGLVRYKALFAQPNVLAMSCEILCALLAYLVISRQAHWVDYGLLVALSFLGLTTFSKTYLILLIVIYGAIFIGLWRRNWQVTLTVTMLLAAIFFTLSVINPNLLQVYLGRFMSKLLRPNSWDSVLNSLTTNRYTLWQVYATYLWQHPWSLLFGQGLGAAVVPSATNLSAHNFYLSLLYQLGIVGTTILITSLVLLIRQYFRCQKVKLQPAVIVPLLVFTLLFGVEDFILYIF